MNNFSDNPNGSSFMNWVVVSAETFVFLKLAGLFHKKVEFMKKIKFNKKNFRQFEKECQSMRVDVEKASYEYAFNLYVILYFLNLFIK